MDDLEQGSKGAELAHPRSDGGDKASRLAAQCERERLANALIKRRLRQRLWSARRAATEFVRPIAGSLLAPMLPYSRTLQKKLQRPKPVQVNYDRETSDRKPLILHLLANFEIGGTPQLVCDIAEYTRNDFRHLIVSKHIPRPAPYQGVNLVDMPLPLSHGNLREIINRNRPDLIHVHYWNGMTQDLVWYHSIFSVISKFTIPIVENVNTSGEPYFTDSVSKYVFCSEWSRRSSGANWNSEEVIYPGTRIENFLREELTEVTDDLVGMVYRLGGDKIGSNAIEVFIEVMKAKSDVNCVIVGDGALVSHFKERIYQENLNDRIEFTGWISYVELQRLYRRLSIFVAPVKDDTFGSVSVYAMCAGIPVVGFEVGGIPEIVGAADLLAPAGDVRRFAEIVVDLLNDRERRLRIGADNQRRAKELFSVSAMADSFGHLYRELIKGAVK